MKQSKADFLRSWGLPYPSFQWHHLRYKNPPEKGVYWYYLSRHVRERDVKKYGACISCGRPIAVDTSNAGHFMPAADCGRDLLFDEKNVNGECPRCNSWDETHLLGYAEGLDLRHGEGTAASLRLRREQYLAGGPLKDHKADFYVARLRDLGIEKLSTPRA